MTSPPYLPVLVRLLGSSVVFFSRHWSMVILTYLILSHCIGRHGINPRCPSEEWDPSNVFDLVLALQSSRDYPMSKGCESIALLASNHWITTITTSSHRHTTCGGFCQNGGTTKSHYGFGVLHFEIWLQGGASWWAKSVLELQFHVSCGYI